MNTDDTTIAEVISGLRPMDGSNEMDAGVALIEALAEECKEFREIQEKTSHRFEGDVFQQMRLGQLAKILSFEDPETEVIFDNLQTPGEFTSYRGSYGDAALAAGSGSISVGELLARLLKFTEGKQTGYKGGEYEMHENTLLWRADYGGHGRPIVGAVPSTMRENTLVLLVDISDD